MNLFKNKGGKLGMSFATYLIAALLIVSYLQYTNPVKYNEMLKPLWGPVKDFITHNNPLGGGAAAATQQETTKQCPDTDEPVCGNGKTYGNICKAALEDVLEVTPGACA